MDLILLAMLSSVPARGADTFEGLRFAYGDPHAHTGLSGDGGSSDLAGTCRDTCGSTTAMFDNARAAGLDWLAITDHVNGENTANVELYEAMHASVLAADDPDGGFVTVPAAEVWFELRTGEPIGHRSLLLFGTDEELAPLTLSDLQIDGTRGIRVDDCSDLDTYMTRVSALLGNALLFPHHPAVTRPMPSDWTCVDEVWSPGVEVYSAHGNSLWDGVTFDPPWSGTTGTGTAHYGMDPDGLGLQLGFFAGTDGHDSYPGSVCDLDPEHRNHPYGGGLTVAVLDAGETFDRGALYRAFVERRVYATTGPRVPVVVSYGSGGAKLGGMGETLGLPAGQDLTVEVRVPEEWADYVLSVEVTFPDTTGLDLAPTGVGTWEVTVPAEDVPAFVYPTLTLDGAAIYAEETCVDGGATSDEHIWLSPSFLEEAAGDLDGDGYDVRAGDCHDGDGAIHPHATEIWDDGVDQDCDGSDRPGYAHDAITSSPPRGDEDDAEAGEETTAGDDTGAYDTGAYDTGWSPWSDTGWATPPTSADVGEGTPYAGGSEAPAPGDVDVSVPTEPCGDTGSATDPGEDDRGTAEGAPSGPADTGAPSEEPPAVDVPAPSDLDDTGPAPAPDDTGAPADASPVDSGDTGGVTDPGLDTAPDTSAEDTGATDSSAGDTSTVDTAAVDVGDTAPPATGETGVGGDTSADTAGADTSAEDTAVSDTADTGLGDAEADRPAPRPARPGCGCAAGGEGVGGAWVPLAVTLLAVRRRRGE